MISISSDTAVAAIAPDIGGRIARLAVEGVDLLVPGDGDDDPMMWGSFPMAPWAGRVRHGSFVLAGRPHQLAVDAPPHAIHGTTWARPWQVNTLDASSVSMWAPLGWEFGGTATQTIEIDSTGLSCELAVRADSEHMPAEVGWHPWFRKPIVLEFAPEAMYRRDEEGIPVGVLVAPGPGPWDDCFLNTDPVRLVYDGVVLTMVSDCDHWVVYDEPLHATCVEPQSGPPDAFNLHPRILEPGEQLTRRLRISWHH